MFVILTSKPGQYKTLANADIEPLKAWDYLFYGRLQAHFVLGRLLRDTRVQVVEDDGSDTVNWVPSKFLESFGSLDSAHEELLGLCSFGSLDAKLVAVPLASAVAA